MKVTKLKQMHKYMAATVTVLSHVVSAHYAITC